MKCFMPLWRKWLPLHRSQVPILVTSTSSVYPKSQSPKCYNPPIHLLQRKNFLYPASVEISRILCTFAYK